MRARYHIIAQFWTTIVLKNILWENIQSVDDNMTSCTCSICGHNFILKSNHNYSHKSTLKKHIESVT